MAGISEKAKGIACCVVQSVVGLVIFLGALWIEERLMDLPEGISPAGEALWAWFRLGAAVVAAAVALACTWVFVEYRFRPVWRIRGNLKVVRGLIGQWISKAAFGDLGIGIGIALVVMAVVVVWTRLESGGPVGDMGWSWSWGIVYGIGAGLGAGVIEEIFFRRTLLRLIRQCAGWVPALLISAAVFGLIHGSGGGKEPGTVGDILWRFGAATAAGLVFGAAWLATGRLWLPVGLHAAWDIMQYAVLGVDVPLEAGGRGVFVSKGVGPDWLTGGHVWLTGGHSVGIDGSVVTIVLFLVATGVLLCRTWSTGRLRDLWPGGGREPGEGRRSAGG